jgi:formylglycine-generating enzyme required for sulfatase activity
MQIVLLVLCGCTSSQPHASPAGPVIGRLWKLPLSESATLDMVWIPPGAFTIGSPDSETPRKADESPQTHVTLTKGFWLGQTTVTIGQWKQVMGRDVREQLSTVIHDDTLYDLGGKQQTVRDFMRFSREADPAQYLANENEDLPMYFVSWNEALAFCKKDIERNRRLSRTA